MNIQEEITVSNITINKEMDRVDVHMRVRFVDSDLTEGDANYERGVAMRSKNYDSAAAADLNSIMTTTEADGVRQVLGW